MNERISAYQVMLIKTILEHEITIAKLRAEIDALKEAYAQGAEYVNNIIKVLGSEAFNDLVFARKIDGISAWLELSPDLPQPPKEQE